MVDMDRTDEDRADALRAVRASTPPPCPLPIPFSEAPGRFTVEIVGKRYVDVDIPSGATWRDYAEAVERAAGVRLGPDGWLLSRHWRQA